MARKPNYQFERQERDRQKANKTALKADAKREQRARDRGEFEDPDRPSDPPADES
jgi:hypothetical protein